MGLSVTSDGYIACGSEDNCVYTYYNTMPAPLCRHSFSSPGAYAQEVCADLAVRCLLCAWRPATYLLCRMRDDPTRHHLLILAFALSLRPAGIVVQLKAM